jgi:hypothetical protein
MGKSLKRLNNEERLKKFEEFRRKLQELKNAPISKGVNFSDYEVKDLPSNFIDNNKAIPIQNAEVNKAKIEALRQETNKKRLLAGMGVDTTMLPEKEYDAGEMKRQYNIKKRLELAEDIKKRGKVPKIGKIAAAIGPIGALAGAALAGSADEALANAVIPGGLEGVGEGSDMPMQDDTQQIKTYSESASDPNLRRMALQELRNRSR